MKLLLICLLMSTVSFAQVGKIAGTVVDEYGDGIIGASVQIVETQQGVSVLNVDGSYVILGVRPGSYTVRVAAVGYRSKEFLEVEVRSHLTTTLNAVVNVAGTVSYSNEIIKHHNRRGQICEEIGKSHGGVSHSHVRAKIQLPPLLSVPARYRKYLVQPSGRECY